MGKIYDFIVKVGDVLGVFITIGTLIADFVGVLEKPSVISLYLIGFILFATSHFSLKINYVFARPIIKVRRAFTGIFTLRPLTTGVTSTTSVTAHVYPSPIFGGEDIIPYNTTSPKGVFEIIDSTNQKEDKYQFALVEIWNQPKIKTELSNANKVLAETYFFDNYGKQLLDREIIYARWWDEKEVPKEGEARRTLRHTELPANNEVRTLAIALSHVEEKMIFAYGVESLPKKEWRKSEYFLNCLDAIAIVVIKGNNMENVNFAFSLRTKEDNNLEFYFMEQIPDFAKDIGKS